MNAVNTRAGARPRRSKDNSAVLTIAFPYAPIGPRAVGGAEVISSQMETAMNEFGFRSVVVAHESSVPQGLLYGTRIPSGTITDAMRASVEAAQQANIDRAIRENAVGLVHMHGLDFHRYRIPEDLRVLVTLHLPPSWYPEAIWDLSVRYQFVCVSESQRKACPERVQGRLSVVENGVVLPPSHRLRREGRYALMLSRVCAEKNLHMGLDAARLAGISVILGGEVFPYAAHETYFHEAIEPRLTQVGLVHESRRCESPASHSARFVGVISQEEKTRVLSRAACLLLPSLAPETSSLVAMEALAAGVPVIAMAVGAQPEIVEHGTTGFLIEPSEKATEQMAEAIRRLPELSRFTCRRIAEKRFPIDRMLYGYAALYLRLAVSPLRLGGRVGGMLDGSRQERCVESSSTLLRAEQVLVQEVSNSEEFSSLEAEWTALWVARPSATPFQHPAWLLPWWRQFGNDGDLYALALRLEKSRDLLSIVPFYFYRSPATSRKQLLLAGAGTTDYLDGIWANDREEFGTLILQRILAVRERWDECSLQQLRAGSPLLRAAERSGVHFGEAESHVCDRRFQGTAGEDQGECAAVQAACGHERTDQIRCRCGCAGVDRAL